MDEEVHGVYFMLNELLKLALVDIAQPIEAGTAHDFLLEPLVEAGAFLIANQHIDPVDPTEGVQKLL